MSYVFPEKEEKEGLAAPPSPAPTVVHYNLKSKIKF
jgi:hypothetical protein